MPVIFQKFYTRTQIQANRSALYVFGDNMARAGYGGQAKEARGEPNSVGIPTKNQPSMNEAAFFTNADLPRVTPIIDAEFNKLRQHLAAGGTVIWPADGIGTQRAQLSERAPLIAEYIANQLTSIRNL